MANRPPREQVTRDLLQDLQARRKRKRRVRIVLVALVGLLLGLALAAAAFSALRLSLERPAQVSLAEPSPLVTLAPVTSSSRGPTTTRTAPPRPSTTESSEPAEGAGGEAATTTVTTAEPPSPATTSPPPAGSVGVVVIDPGHQAQGDSRQEPIGPGSGTTKPRVASGTRGVATGIPEHELALAVGLKLRNALEQRGVQVVMTRTTAAVNLSNVERTKIANEARADLFIRVHADGSPNGSAARGIHVLYPAVTKGWTDDIAAPSKRAAVLAQQALVAATGAPDRGVDARSDMTGFNWSDVPVIIPEIGFLTNPDEDRLLATEAYRQKIADALADAAVRFLKES